MFNQSNARFIKGTSSFIILGLGSLLNKSWIDWNIDVMLIYSISNLEILFLLNLMYFDLYYDDSFSKYDKGI